MFVLPDLPGIRPRRPKGREDGMGPRPAECAAQQLLRLDPTAAPETGRAGSPAIATPSDCADQIRLAQSFGYRVVTSWWRAAVAGEHPIPPLREPPTAFAIAELPEPTLARADRTGAAAARL